MQGLITFDVAPEAAAVAYRERVVGPYRGVLPDAAVSPRQKVPAGALFGDAVSIPLDLAPAVIDIEGTAYVRRRVTLERVRRARGHRIAWGCAVAAACGGNVDDVRQNHPGGDVDSAGGVSAMRSTDPATGGATTQVAGRGGSGGHLNATGGILATGGLPATGGAASPDASVDRAEIRGTRAIDASADTSTPDAGRCALSRSDALARIRTEREEEVEKIFGGLASGKTPVYEGTATASDNLGVMVGYQDGRLTGSVRAVALPTSDYPLQGPGHVLVIVSAAQRKWIQVAQPGDGPGIAQLGIILDFDSEGGSFATSAQSLSAFGAAPSSLAFMAHGSGTWPTGDPLVVDVQVALTRVPPEKLVYDDVLLLLHGGGLFGFEASGAEHVRPVHQVFSAPTCTPDGANFADGECFHNVLYSAVDFVEDGALANHGVRDLVVEAVSVCCTHCMPNPDCELGSRTECFP